MTRAFVKGLTSSENGDGMWTDLWKTFPYGESEEPDQFHDKGLVIKDLDECFHDHWPLMVQNNDQIVVSL